MALDEATLRRLSFVRYMYMLGANQSRQPEPYSAVSLLTFHDAAELFLQLAAEHLDAPVKNDTRFVAYWDLLKPKLNGDGLSQKQAMNRLNKARVALKHHGNRPSKEDTVGYRVIVGTFFQENTPTVFDIEFEDATLINFVKPDSARQGLVQARASQEEGNLVYALAHAGIAFHEVVEGPLEQIGTAPLGALSSYWAEMRRLMSLRHSESSEALEQIINMISTLEGHI